MRRKAEFAWDVSDALSAEEWDRAAMIQADRFHVPECTPSTLSDHRRCASPRKTPILEALLV